MKRIIPIAPIGCKLFLPLLAAAVLSFLLGSSTLGLILLLLAGSILFFFRDPERTPPKIKGAILSPADGKVLSVEEVEHPEIKGRKAIKTTIFLSLFDVHVTRAPIKGDVTTIRYQPGRFYNAMKDVASLKNEHNVIGLNNGKHVVFTKQIAGIIARRIICHCQVGQRLQAGERMGLICFGSRVEAYLPPETDLKVRKGMRVTGGRSVLGILSQVK